MDILEQLKDDSHYYGRLGSHYLSNSKIGTLLTRPKLFLEKEETTVPMVMGRYFHTAMLEPEKLDNFQFVSASNRNTNIYKDAAKGSPEPIMLTKEKEQMDFCIGEMKRNKEFADLIYAEGNKFEEPMIKEIFGVEWKGKADIVHADFILDIKTTSDIHKFAKYSAKKYNYDSQAWLYQQFFDRPMKFLVVDKTTGELGIFDVTDEFLDGGEGKVYRAVEVYNKFFGENATDDVNEYIVRDYLI